jgi:hypothetical protein
MLPNMYDQTSEFVCLTHRSGIKLCPTHRGLEPCRERTISIRSRVDSSVRLHLNAADLSPPPVDVTVLLIMDQQAGSHCCEETLICHSHMEGHVELRSAEGGFIRNSGQTSVFFFFTLVDVTDLPTGRLQ